VESALLVRDARVPLLAATRGGLPLRVTQAVHRALERDPARRFASAIEMLDELRSLLRILAGSTDAISLAKSVTEARSRLKASGDRRP
jgi:hypothetical protein